MVNYNGTAINIGFPLIAQHYLNGNLELDKMVPRRISLNDVEKALHEM